MAAMNNGGDNPIVRILRSLGIGGTESSAGDLDNLDETSLSGIHSQYLATFAIRSALDYEASLATGKPDASAHLKVAQSLARYIYEHGMRGRNIVFPLHTMIEGATDTGALGIAIDPDRGYPISGHNYFVLKDADDVSAEQAFRDSLSFQDNPDFKLEHIVARVPMGDRKSFLWKQFIIGPNLSEVFSRLDDGIRRAPESERRALTSLEATLSEIAAGRLFYWQQNSPDLIAEARNYQRVVDTYVNNIAEALRGFAQFTDAPITEQEISNVQRTFNGIDWNFVNAQTTVRNLGATYRNWVLQTGKINLAYDDLLRLFATEPNGKGPKVKKEALGQALFFVDTPSKYSHALEDAWEMDLAVEGRAKKKAVDYLKGRYSSLEQGSRVNFSSNENALMHTYRAFRRAYLILTRHWERNDQMLAAGDISKEDYERNKERHQREVRYLVNEGNRAVQQLVRYSLIAPQTAETFANLGKYTTIKR